MERLVLAHLSGSKANQVDEFPLGEARDLLLGRDPGAAILFDADRDDLVGRQHARILRDPADPYKFSITDLNSRNGTFVNRQRVTGTVVLTPGDVIQLGPGGPELRFSIDPLPPHLVKATRVADEGASVPATREASSVPVAAPGEPAAGREKVAVGKATVERLVGEARAESRKRVFGATGAVVVVVLAAVVGLAWWWNQRVEPIEQSTEALAAAERNRPWTTEAVATSFTESTVFVEVGWKLVLTGRGEQIYHEYHVPTDQKGQPARNAQGQALSPMPVYVRLEDGSIEPSLTIDRGSQGQNQPIGGQHTGSGFVVTTDGFILTNRHVAATWETSYSFPPVPGVLVDLGNLKADPTILEHPPGDWVPAAAKVIGRALVGKNVEGSLTYLDVTFARNKLRFPATIARVSDVHDVALIKVSTPQPVKKVDLYDSYDQVKVGQNVTVMGYPGVSPLVAMRARSDDPFSRQDQVRTVPDPTVTPGSIGRVIRGQLKPTGGQAYDYLSEFGDAYQLTVTATGSGNSGGPVFDDYGRVIAIYTSGKWDPHTVVRISFAVPVRYGMELMGTRPVI